MPEVSPALRERARKIETDLRNRLADVSQTRMAESLGVSESTVSRWKDAEIEKVALYLASLGLKVVPFDANLITADEVSAMRILSMRGLRAMEGRGSSPSMGGTNA